MTEAAAPEEGRRGAVEIWAARGAMFLTGRPGRRPLGPPAKLVEQVIDLGARLERSSAAHGRRLRVDGVDLLVQRAAILGLVRQGDISCGGATRLVATRDGWLAVALARPDDAGLVPAWLEPDDQGDDADPWPVVSREASGRSGRELVERAAGLGLPVAMIGERTRAAGDQVSGAVIEPLPGPPAPPRPLAGCRVVDLSSLWAGPLCGQLLRRAGANVVKVESTARPDGSRSGPAAFFDLMNTGKRSVALDFTQTSDVARLQRLMARADLIIEGSRPRALTQLGIDPATMAERGGPQVWVSITGHGRSGPGANRVGFGDDCAAAGGLVAWDRGHPLFCADAVADPLAGLTAATEAVEALARGGRWLIDVALSAVAAAAAGPTLAVPPTVVPAAPARPAPTRPGPRLGQHTHLVLAELAA